MSPEQLLHEQRSVGERFIDAIDRKFAVGKHESGRQHEEMLQLRPNDTMHYSWKNSIGIILQRPKPGESTLAADEWRRFGGYRLTVVMGLPKGTEGAVYTGETYRDCQIDYVPVLDKLSGQMTVFERVLTHGFLNMVNSRPLPRERHLPEAATIHDGNALGFTALDQLRSEGQPLRQLRPKEAKAILKWIKSAEPLYPKIPKQRSA